MKTEELKQIGLTDEQIKEVFKLNGKDVTAMKESTTAEMQTKIDGLNTQLSTATSELKKFEGVEPEKLAEQIAALNTQLATQKADYEKQIADRDFNDLLSKSITKAGGRNDKAVKAMLDLDTLRKSKNQDKDIEAALEQVKKDNDYLFVSNEPFNNPVGSTNNGGAPNGAGGLSLEAEAKARAVMGLPPLKND